MNSSHKTMKNITNFHLKIVKWLHPKIRSISFRRVNIIRLARYSFFGGCCQSNMEGRPLFKIESLQKECKSVVEREYKNSIPK